MLLSEIVAATLSESPTLMLSTEQVTKHLRRAVRQYCAYAQLSNGPADIDGIHSYVTAENDLSGLDQDVDLTVSELGVIKPLYDLYVEEEQALMVEASRANGLDAFGRSVGEVRQSIQEMETVTFPKLASFELPETI